MELAQLEQLVETLRRSDLNSLDVAKRIQESLMKTLDTPRSITHAQQGRDSRRSFSQGSRDRKSSALSNDF
jgi:hypothetical protein